MIPQKLAAALVAFQAEMPTVGKANTANVPTKAGGSYRYTYADLADVVTTATPTLTKHGLAFTCRTSYIDGLGLTMTACLVHESGDTIDALLSLDGRTPQEIGSSMTYARRYLFGCLTGVVTDTDDDGQAASHAAATRRQAHPPQSRPTGPERPAQDPERDAYAAAVRRIGGHLNNIGITENADKLAFLSDQVGRPLENAWGLTVSEAEHIDRVLADAAREAEHQPGPSDEEAPE